MVEQWSNNRLLSATVDQIPLGAMIYILNKKEKTGIDAVHDIWGSYLSIMADDHGIIVTTIVR